MSLREKWDEKLRTLHGLMSHDFPNMFVVGAIAQTGGTVNFPLCLRVQAEHAIAVIETCLDKDIVRIEPTAEAEDRWVQTIRDKAVNQASFFRDCTPGYYNGEGKLDEAFFSVLYGGGPFEYFDVLEDWRNGRIWEDTSVEFAETPKPS